MITINPPNPIPGQLIEFGRASGPCGYTGTTSLSIAGDRITFTIEQTGICGVPPGLQFNWEVSGLSAGSYTVEYNVSTILPDDSRVVSTIDSENFIVAPAGSVADFHGVPLLPPLGVAALIIGILVLAYKRL